VAGLASGQLRAAAMSAIWRFIVWCVFIVGIIAFWSYMPVWLAWLVIVLWCGSYLATSRRKRTPRRPNDGDYEWRKYHDLKGDE